MGGWKGVLVVNLSGFERGEGKDMAMASARLLGVLFLPGETKSEERGLRPSFSRNEGLFSSSGGASSLSLHFTPRGKKGGR